jgi:hypothetical protein
VQRRVIIEFEGNEMEYQIALGLIFRQMMRGQVRGCGPTYRYRVETAHAPEGDSGEPDEVARRG